MTWNHTVAPPSPTRALPGGSSQPPERQDLRRRSLSARLLGSYWPAGLFHAGPSGDGSPVDALSVVRQEARPAEGELRCVRGAEDARVGSRRAGELDEGCWAVPEGGDPRIRARMLIFVTIIGTPSRSGCSLPTSQSSRKLGRICAARGKSDTLNAPGLDAHGAHGALPIHKVHKDGERARGCLPRSFRTDMLSGCRRTRCVEVRGGHT